VDLLLSAAPLMLAALGALWTELAAFLAISIEAWLSMGAFLAFSGTVRTNSPFLGTVFAVLVTAAAAFLSARFIIRSRSNLYVAGLAINLGTAGLIPLLSRLFFGTGAVLRSRRFAAMPDSGINIPPFLLCALACAVLSALILRKTPLGLRLIASGKSARGAAERGINPFFYKELSWAAGAGLAALGGAAMTFRIGVYAPGAVSGRGWLALAAVFLGFRSVRGVCAASLVFAAAEHIALSAQGSTNIPAEALLGLPSFIALVLYSVSAKLKLGK